MLANDSLILLFLCPLGHSQILLERVEHLVLHRTAVQVAAVLILLLLLLADILFGQLLLAQLV